MARTPCAFDIWCLTSGCDFMDTICNRQAQCGCQRKERASGGVADVATQDLSTEAKCQRHFMRLQVFGMFTLEPERFQNQPTPTREKITEDRKGSSPEDAQAACDFSFSRSKFSLFFHRVSVMAAILRASVRRPRRDKPAPDH